LRILQMKFVLSSDLSLAELARLILKMNFIYNSPWKSLKKIA